MFPPSLPWKSVSMSLYSLNNGSHYETGAKITFIKKEFQHYEELPYMKSLTRTEYLSNHPQAYVVNPNLFLEFVRQM